MEKDKKVGITKEQLIKIRDYLKEGQDELNKKIDEIADKVKIINKMFDKMEENIVKIKDNSHKDENKIFNGDYSD